MSYLDETDPRWSDASRARRRDAAPDSYVSATDDRPLMSDAGAGSRHNVPGYGGGAGSGGSGAGSGGSRAGRNVPLSIVVGLTLLVVVLSPLFFWKQPGFLLV